MLELESELRGEMLFASRKQSLSIQEISSHIWRRAHFPSIRRAHFSVRQYLEARAGLFAHTKVCATLVGAILKLEIWLTAVFCVSVALRLLDNMPHGMLKYILSSME